MSVLFTAKSASNPVRKGMVESILHDVSLEIRDDESDDFCSLLAAVHECAEHIMAQPDYIPMPDLQRYPRGEVKRPLPHENEFGNAWAHRFHIQGSNGLLHGLSICLKDNIAVSGVPILYGTEAIAPWVPNTDATVVTRLLDSGANIVGTTVCENFCHSTSSFTSGQGVIHNPFATGYSAGGSTSGGAALVGGGIVDVAIGADQGGSIRIPAAFCGCVGFKATHGLVPYTGLLSGDPIIDHAGPLTKTVAQAAKVMDVISGYDGIDDRGLGAGPPGSFGFAEGSSGCDSQDQPLQGFNIGILQEGFGTKFSDPRVDDIVEHSAQLFKELGATVKTVSIPGHLQGPAIWTIQQRIAGSQNLMGRQHGRHGLYLHEFDQKRLPWTREAFLRLFPSTQNVLINGLYLDQKFPGLYGKTMNLARQLRDQYETALQHFDVLITPTTPKVAPRHGTWGSPLESLEPSIGITVNTCGFNVTGQPALAIPVGLVCPPQSGSDVRLPVSMQIIGGLWQDEKVLKVGRAWETKFNWQNLEKRRK